MGAYDTRQGLTRVGRIKKQNTWSTNTAFGNDDR
jgi:hypothetical protein